MKKTIKNILLLVLLGTSSTAFAQGRITKSTNDGYLRQNGRIVEIRDGKTYPMNNQVTLSEGVTLLNNGTLVRRDGARYSLEDGQAVDILGQILYPQNDRNGDIILLPRQGGNEDYSRDRRVGKNGRQGPPYGNAYGHYKNKGKKDKDKKYKKDDKYDKDRRWDRDDD